MKYSIENNGLGFCQIKVSVPESLAGSFLSFIENQTRQTSGISSKNRKPSPVLDDDYLIRMGDTCFDVFNTCLTSGMSKSLAISDTLKKIKVLGFYNVSYDRVKSILTQKGCFKASTPQNIAS